MNIRDLEYVAAVDRFHNFGKAAEACHVSQPSLSTQVKRLEERLGVELFARTNHGVVTSEAGSRIVTIAKEVLRNVRRMDDTAAEYRDPLAAPMRIGIIPTLAPFFIPYMRTKTREYSQNLSTIFRELPTEKLFAELDGRKIDVALLSGPVKLSGSNFTPIFREPLWLVVSETHRLAEVAAIAVEEIPVEEMLLLTEEHCLRAETIELCGNKNVGIDMPDQFLASNLLTMLHYLSGGIGCSLVPSLARECLERAAPNARFVKIDADDYSRDIGFVSRTGCPREKMLKAICDQIRADPPGDTIALE
ncbi:MAG: LysR substrate-binding domain-containing protein [Erythrobacter sp.]